MDIASTVRTALGTTDLLVFESWAMGGMCSNKDLPWNLPGDGFAPNEYTLTRLLIEGTNYFGW